MIELKASAGLMAFIAIAFGAGFALPVPPLVAVARIALLVAGWSALR